MSLVPITLQIEEMQFIPVMRVLKYLPGVANIEWNFDELGAPLGGNRKPKTTEPENQQKQLGLKETVIRILMDGGRRLADLREPVGRVGFKSNSISQALNDLRKAQVVERTDHALWQLTAKA